MLKHGRCICAKRTTVPRKVGEAALSQDSRVFGSSKLAWQAGMSAYSHPATATGLICQLDGACGVMAQACSQEPWAYVAWHMCWSI